MPQPESEWIRDDTQQAQDIRHASIESTIDKRMWKEKNNGKKRTALLYMTIVSNKWFKFQDLIKRETIGLHKRYQNK